MKKLRRAGIIVLSKQKMVDWLNAHRKSFPFENGYTMEEARKGSNIYLFDDEDFEDGVYEALEKNFQKIVKNEFKEWDENSEIWPKIDSYKEFKEWFDLVYHCTLIDMVDGSDNQLDYRM